MKITSIRDLEHIYAQLDRLNRCDDWSIYYYDDLLSFIRTVHSALYNLIDFRDNCDGVQYDYKKLEEYIEIASNLEKNIDRACITLRCGHEVYVEWV